MKKYKYTSHIRNSRHWPPCPIFDQSTNLIASEQKPLTTNKPTAHYVRRFLLTWFRQWRIMDLPNILSPKNPHFLVQSQVKSSKLIFLHGWNKVEVNHETNNMRIWVYIMRELEVSCSPARKIWLVVPSDWELYLVTSLKGSITSIPGGLLSHLP